MFTGLVRELGNVVELRRQDGGARLRIDAQCADEVERGDSVLVNGVCLTATDANTSELVTELSSETIARSTLGDLEAGDAVNLELSLRPADRLGGHIVQGHVDGVATIDSISRDGAGREVRFVVSRELLRYVVEKGSVALDGVSLTVTSVDESGFSVSLIPETLERTNLTKAVPGRRVNLEVDVIAKYVERLVQR